MIDKKAETSSQGPETKPVVDLLTSILDEFRKQVQSKPRKPLEGAALQAVEQFREITASLGLQRRPTITLTANPPTLTAGGGNVTLTWRSTEAQTVSLDKREFGKEPVRVQELTPVADGVIDVFVPLTTDFTATAKGPCASATATATVTVAGVE